MTFAKQIALLLRYFPDVDGQLYSANHLAHRLEMSPQAVLNLIQGDAPNPRLDTVRRLCRFFGIKLDYFGLETAKACESYLQCHLIQVATPTVRAIQTEVDELSPRAAANVLVLMSWAERGEPSSINP
jgi:transcriptional regulator with XRE-family HTH domain